MLHGLEYSSSKNDTESLPYLHQLGTTPKIAAIIFPHPHPLCTEISK
jgi:hypothetical protein